MTSSGPPPAPHQGRDSAHAAYRDFEVPHVLRAEFDEVAARWLDSPMRQEAPRPRLSASVLLLREGTGGLEVFVQRRVPQMAFAGGMTVYPGGAVDPRDSDGDLDCVHSAATRELFEECGVLLAGQTAESVLSDLSGPRWQAHRAALVSGGTSLAQVLDTERLTARTDLLTPVARWVTPECKPRRFDTFFFAATLPPGQEADGRTSEASVSHWVSARQLMQEHLDGPGVMMTPTQVLAEQVARASSVHDYLAQPRSMAPVLPAPVRVEGQLLTRAPIDARGVRAVTERG